MDNPQRNLFLDYGELIVRYHFSPETFDRAHAIAQDRINSVNGYNVSLDQIRNAHKTSVQEYLEARKDGTEWSMDKITGLMLRNLRADEVNPSHVADIYKLNDHDFELIPNAEKTLRNLRLGYSLGIISNLPHDSLIHELSTLGLIELFDNITISGQVGYRKPRSEIYQRALSIARTTPKRSTFISHDKEEVVGAERVRIRGILVKSLEEVMGVL